MCQEFGTVGEERGGKKKNPLAAGDKRAGSQECCGESTARSRAGSTTATAAQRIGGGDGKPGTVSGFDEVNFNGTATFLEVFFHQEFQVAFLIHFVAVFWLIQSQTQRWATSATLHQCDANSRTDLVLLQVGFQIIYSKRCDFTHLCLLKSWNAPSEKKKGYVYGGKSKAQSSLRQPWKQPKR